MRSSGISREVSALDITMPSTSTQRMPLKRMPTQHIPIQPMSTQSISTQPMQLENNPSQTQKPLSLTDKENVRRMYNIQTHKKCESYRQAQSLKKIWKNLH